MIFPDSKRIFYDRNTLCRVVLQLRFNSPLKIEETPDVFKSRVDGICPVYMQVHARDGSKGVIHVFKNDNTGRSIELSDRALTIVFIDYQRWEDFYEFHLKSLDAFKATYNVPSFSRIGLRYVDRFLDTELNADNWRSLLKTPFLGLMGMNDGSLNGFQLMQELKLDAPNAKVMIITSSLIRNDACCGVQLDYDCSVNETTAYEEIKQRLDYLHVQSRNIFEYVITDELRKIMGVREQ